MMVEEELEKRNPINRRKDREELIRRPRKERRGGRKFAMVSRWDPRGPNIKEGLKQLESILYDNPDNIAVFPRGSIIPAFSRGRNLGEHIAPTNPVRERRERVEGGCYPCTSPRGRCLLHQSGALQQVSTITNRGDGRVWRITKRITCSTRNLVYHIRCPCTTPRDYVGSAQDFKRRFSKHKSDCRMGRWENCGVTRHFQQFHQGNMEEAINSLKVTLVDYVMGAFSEEKLLQLEKNWILKLGTFGPLGLNTRNELVTNNRRNWGHH